MLKDLLARLPSLRKSQEFADIIPDLERQLTRAEAAAVDLKADLKRALFESPERSKAVKARIAENSAEQESLQLAIDGARDRQQEAAQIEMADEVERRIEAVRQRIPQLYDEAAALHEASTTAAKSLTAIHSISDDIRAANQFAAEHGRRDLKLANPLIGFFQTGSTGTMHREDPRLFRMPGYFPVDTGGSKAGEPALATFAKAKQP